MSRFLLCLIVILYNPANVCGCDDETRYLNVEGELMLFDKLMMEAPVSVSQNIFHSGSDEFEVRHDLLDSHISICSPQVSFNPNRP